MKYGKTIKISLSALLIILVLSATAAAVGLGVSPASFTVSNAFKGGEYERTVTVYNTGDDGGDFTFRTEGAGGEWMTVYEVGSDETIDITTIDGKGSQKILIKINIPEDAANGNYTPKMYIKSVPNELEGAQGAVAQAVVQIPVDATIDVTGTQILAGIVNEISMMDIEVEYPLRLKVDFKNTGNVVAEPQINVDITQDGMMVDSFLSSDTSIKPETSEEINVELDTNGLDVGSYMADISVGLSEETISYESISFEIMEKGTLTRLGVFKAITYEGEPLINRVVKVVAEFENTGLIDTNAKFKGEIYLDGNLVDAIESDELVVPVGETETLTTYYKIEVPGSFDVKGHILYEGKKSDLQEFTFEVPEAQSEYESPGFGIIGALAVLGTLAFVRSKRRKD